MIDDLVLQDAHQPCPHRGAGGKPVARLQRPEKSFLDRVLSRRRIAKPRVGIAIQQVAMLINPGVGIQVVGLGFFHQTGALTEIRWWIR